MSLNACDKEHAIIHGKVVSNIFTVLIPPFSCTILSVHLTTRTNQTF